MTRDEAIEIDFAISRDSGLWNDQTLSEIRNASISAVDSYIALGMLKLDEPETPWAKFKREFCALGYGPDDSAVLNDIRDVKVTLERCNLKIVEK